MTAVTLLFERLQVMREDASRDGALNMALDEILLDSADSAPVLRFYRWARPTVSFGYFEPADAARRVARGRGIVRRWTGGGIVEHGDDLTFTLVVPRGEVFARVRPAESYRAIHAALARALERVGIVSHAHEGPPPGAVNASVPNACFERPVLHDLMARSTKVAGGAQRRTQRGLLHQGSVRPVLAGKRSWKEAVRGELPLAFARVCEARTFTPGEIAGAATLAEAKYATAAWTDRI